MKYFIQYKTGKDSPAAVFEFLGAGVAFTNQFRAGDVASNLQDEGLITHYRVVNERGEKVSLNIWPFADEPEPRMEKEAE